MRLARYNPMMNKAFPLLRTSAAAIAASAVLSPGLALAQEVDPTNAAPVETPAPVATPEAIVAGPVADDPLSPATDTAAPAVSEPAPVATTTSPRTPQRDTRVNAAPRTAQVQPASAVAAPAEPNPAVTEAASSEPAPLIGQPTVADDSAVAPAPIDASNDDLAPIAAGAGAGLLALLGIGMAMRRRKVNRADVAVASEPRITRTMVDEPAPIATTPTSNPRPAFAFGRAAAAAPMAAAGGNRMERALEGPTPDNPFLSLKKRLKRAAFFDQRERQLRDGTGTRVSPMAGLPDRLVEKLKAATKPQASPRYQWA